MEVLWKWNTTTASLMWDAECNERKLLILVNIGFEKNNLKTEISIKICDDNKIHSLEITIGNVKKI